MFQQVSLRRVQCLNRLLATEKKGSASEQEMLGVMEIEQIETVSR